MENSDSIKMEIDDGVEESLPSRRWQPLKTCAAQYYYLNVEMWVANEVLQDDIVSVGKKV